ncbi:Wzz/FepE/Etk N-terminal domain-containing protein [Spirochaetia bacterium 38H-sp]|uniref:Wzz/FepE/Etk N-terminal domain-containing protein n=1 Tax=Rarispira pelagica TaxID=3141764 RepID=A0ABU9UBC0_9SPIR
MSKRDVMNSGSEEITFSDLVMVFIKNIRVFLSFSFLVILGALFYAIITPEVYTAKAIILNNQTSSNSSISKILSVANSGDIASLLSGTSVSSIYPVVLKSDSAALYVIDSLNLRNTDLLKNAKSVDEMIGVMTDNLKIGMGTSGEITISFSHKSPSLAADIVNTYIEALEVLTAKITSTPAKRKQIYLENKINTIREELDSAQKKLVTFQNNNNIWDADNQIKSIINEISRLTIEKEKVLLDHRANANFGIKEMTPVDRGHLLAIDATINKYKQELNRLGGMYLDYLDLYRMVKVKESVYNFLSTQYEQTKLEELDEVSVVSVLEYARVPDRRSWPKRKNIVLLGVLGGVFLGIFMVFLIDFIRRIKKEVAEKY